MLILFFTNYFDRSPREKANDMKSINSHHELCTCSACPVLLALFTHVCVRDVINDFLFV